MMLTATPAILDAAGIEERFGGMARPNYGGYGHSGRDDLAKLDSRIDKSEPWGTFVVPMDNDDPSYDSRGAGTPLVCHFFTDRHTSELCRWFQRT